jgi:hypothetical protein
MCGRRPDEKGIETGMPGLLCSGVQSWRQVVFAEVRLKPKPGWLDMHGSMQAQG